MDPKTQSRWMIDGMRAMQTRDVNSFYTALNCAQYAVQEIINSDPQQPWGSVLYEDGTEDAISAREYWMQVKEELSKAINDTTRKGQ